MMDLESPDKDSIKLLAKVPSVVAQQRWQIEISLFSSSTHWHFNFMLLLPTWAPKEKWLNKD